MPSLASQGDNEDKRLGLSGLEGLLARSRPYRHTLHAHQQMQGLPNPDAPGMREHTFCGTSFLFLSSMTFSPNTHHQAYSPSQSNRDRTKHDHPHCWWKPWS